jgi:hypothetical protein
VLGRLPSSADDAERIFEDLRSSVSDEDPPTDVIRSYVEELLHRWPDITQDGGKDSPWADRTLSANACGRFLVFSLVSNSLNESIPYCVEVARRRRIVLHDREQNEVYSTANVPRLAKAAPATSSGRRFFRRK